MTLTTKDERLALRLTHDQKQTIQAASAVLGRSVTDFAIQSTVERANQILADQRVFHVPADRWEEFERLMDTPVEPNEGLVRLFSEPSVFVSK